MRYRTQDLNGVLNVYKEKGYTSFDVVAIVRKLTGAKSGHTGTLDPDAEGVLPVCLGKATKLVELLTEHDKEYIAGVKLGITTDTQDASGSVLETKPVNLSEEDIRCAVNSFVGSYEQIPPMYSAIKIGGKRLYDLAREGKEIERKARPVVIYGLEILELNENELSLRVLCSKGTYIRALAADIGEKLGCGAHMSSLLRTKTGNFEIKNSLKISEIKRKIEESGINDILINMEDCLPGFDRASALPSADSRLKNGNPININELKLKPSSQKVLVFTSDDALIGIYEQKGDMLKLIKMLN